MQFTTSLRQHLFFQQSVIAVYNVIILTYSLEPHYIDTFFFTFNNIYDIIV